MSTDTFTPGRMALICIALTIPLALLMHWGMRRDAQRAIQRVTADGNTIVLDRDGFGHPRTIARTITLNGCQYVAVLGVGGTEGTSMTHAANCPNPIHAKP